MEYLYKVHGLLIGSSFPLPELEWRRHPPVRTPDVCIALGPLPPAALQSTEIPYLGASGGEAVMTIPNAGRYLVRGGREVLIEPAPDADLSLIRLFLFGSVMGLVCHQRGLLPLHASAVASNGEVIAFLGEQGEGKSTLAAHCLGRGSARLVADDILVVSFDEQGQPWAQPGMLSLKLWRDALAAIGRAPDGLRPDWFRADKFHLPVAEQLTDAPIPLSRIYMIETAPDAGAVRITTMSGAVAAAALIANTYRVEYLDAADHRIGHFGLSTRLARSVLVSKLSRRRDLAAVEHAAEMVLGETQETMAAAQ